jgi:hypothetical protein
VAARDPIHDFGFYKFDPSELHHMRVSAIPLVPHEAVVGTEIRVVGVRPLRLCVLFPVACSSVRTPLPAE